jgi:hypothetical protein
VPSFPFFIACIIFFIIFNNWVTSLLSVKSLDFKSHESRVPYLSYYVFVLTAKNYA